MSMRFRFGIVSVILTVMLAWPVWGQVPGDVDGDGTVTQADADMFVQHLLDLTVLDASQEVRADCNGQVGRDAGDLVWIINRSHRSTPQMVSIPAGSFDMGDPWSEGGINERPVHTVSLSAFEIGRYEVTNAEYAAFLNSTSVTVTSGVVYLTGNGSDPLFDTYPSGSLDSQIAHSGGTFTVRTRDGFPMYDHPVTEVTWYGAAAYCNWLSAQQGHQEVYTESGTWPSDLSRNGYHLPTEAQWERAAGWEPGHGHWRFGFTSDTISQTQANYYDGGHANPLNLINVPYTSPVGHYGGSTSDAGCYDMSGNLWEWCNDWYSISYYSSSPGTNPEGPSSGNYRVLRGGGWNDVVGLSRSAYRLRYLPGVLRDNLGFRVGRGFSSPQSFGILGSWVLDP